MQGGDPQPRVPIFPVDAFAGTAPFYVDYRPPYPDALLAGLVGHPSITGNGRLLDIACGPGRLTLPLAASFREVLAIDLEPEMIDAAKNEAARRHVDNVNWRVGFAEDMEATGDAFELITIGEAFHRLDQDRVASLALRCLEPGCRLATLGCYTILSAREPWQKIVTELVMRWTRPLGNNAPGGRPANGPENYERVMRRMGFVDVGTHSLTEPLEWTIPSILGYLYSTSVCSKAVLGGNAGAFESELTAALKAHHSGGRFMENLQWGYTSGTKPA